MKRWISLSLLLGACVAPDQNDPVRYGTYIVALVPPIHHEDPTLDVGPWRPDQIEILTKCFKDFSRLGPNFVIGPDTRAQLWLRPYNAAVESGIKNQSGHYFQDMGMLVECDPGRTPGYDALCACAAHEAGHWLGMRHICIKPDDAPDCSPVGYGLAVMNPSLLYGDNTYMDEIAQPTPTDLDLQEFQKTRARTAP